MNGRSIRPCGGLALLVATALMAWLGLCPAVARARDQGAEATRCAAPGKATEVEIVVTGAEGARVSVDGREVGTAPLTVTLCDGRHSVQASLKGFFPAATSLELSGQPSHKVSLQLQRVLVTRLDEEDGPAPVPDAEVERGAPAGQAGATAAPWRGSNTLAWSMLGTGVAAFVAGGALLGHVAWLETRDLKAGQRVEGAAVELGVGAGLAAVGAGLGVGSLFVFERAASVSLVPLPGGAAVGITLR